MSAKIAHIYLSVDDNQEEGINYEKENTDVIVCLEGGNMYVATFFTYQNIESYRKEHQKTGEFLHGAYFWVKQMVLVESSSRATIEAIVHYLMDEGDFFTVFKRL